MVIYPAHIPTVLDTVTGGATQGSPITITLPQNDGVTADTYVFAEAPAGATLTDGGHTLEVPGEGTWTSDGSVFTFTPVEGFTGQPTVVGYTGASTTA